MKLEVFYLKSDIFKKNTKKTVICVKLELQINQLQ